jgi:hypothetical protein
MLSKLLGAVALAQETLAFSAAAGTGLGVGHAQPMGLEARCYHRDKGCSLSPDPTGELGLPGVQNCTEHVFEQRLDHFSYVKRADGIDSFKQVGPKSGNTDARSQC